jgi:hypothetical protein
MSKESMRFMENVPSRRQFLIQSAATAFLSTQSSLAANAQEEQLFSGSNLVADSSQSQTEELIKDEKEVINEIDAEEGEERQAIEDTNKLISKLEEQIKEEKASDEPQAPAEESIQSSTKNLIDNLEKEEEKIENETKELISKLETLEKIEELQQEKQVPEAAPLPTAETKEFLNKLKERVEEKEDLIARLKRESQKDVDPKTGMFKAMTGKDFKARAPSDFDFLQYLKDSVTNNQEFERDLDAFKGLLDKKLGPVLEQMKNVETQLGPVVDEVRRAATPMVESAVEEVRKAVQDAVQEAK